ncbi:hypothetical protein [Albirhodobacter sp. R86504]|jgi:hypothetical protein|uniref:hypothetical protein n=1 Tax=Albirhodobacter sp. R86504 TaxID=3093848 RepID=UPI00366F38A4
MSGAKRLVRAHGNDGMRARFVTIRLLFRHPPAFCRAFRVAALFFAAFKILPLDKISGGATLIPTKI